jgi:hypothetical protein
MEELLNRPTIKENKRIEVELWSKDNERLTAQLFVKTAIAEKNEFTDTQIGQGFVKLLNFDERLTSVPGGGSSKANRNDVLPSSFFLNVETIKE